MDTSLHLGGQSGCMRLVSRPTTQVPCTLVPVQIGERCLPRQRHEMMAWESAISHGPGATSHHNNKRDCDGDTSKQATSLGWTQFYHEHFFSNAFALYASLNPFPVKGTQPHGQTHAHLELPTAQPLFASPLSRPSWVTVHPASASAVGTPWWR